MENLAPQLGHSWVRRELNQCAVRPPPALPLRRPAARLTGGGPGAHVQRAGGVPGHHRLLLRAGLALQAAQDPGGWWRLGGWLGRWLDSTGREGGS